MPLFKIYPPAYIQVSIYGNSDNQYEFVTGKRCYNKVKSNIDYAIGSGLPVGIAITTSKYLKIFQILLDYIKQGIYQLLSANG